MAYSITVTAPAKINIGLRVLPKRLDGYHDIESIFTTVSLCDTLTVSLDAPKETCIVECEGMVLPLENTFTKAYKAFCVLTGTKYGVRVNVTKRIPSGGGLGGGSSDASSFIQSIDRLFNTRLASDDLHKIAGLVGSDVFFFTHALIKGNERPFTAVVKGRGEFITPIESRNDYSVILIFPNVSVSTKDAYSWVDSYKGKRFPPINMEKEFLKPIKEWQFSNDFTTPVSERFKEIVSAIAALKNCGADFADMSGSGSTVFGIFAKKEGEEVSSLARSSFEVLKKNWRIALA
ncbi:MAG: 4-(cytidine 5'-diphospho)-2-C-methyl-D-erythritol kinase [Treponema sp.]|nr:4-(cytidine 5'-diphospho)-2-C-methyl-D-erythritol kinase [Treponema sp.]